MLRIENKSKHSQSEVIKKAIKHFNGGYGLEVKEQSDDFVRFEGGGGGVSVSTRTEDNKTVVEVLSREWDFQAKEFLTGIS
jgi:hypothetical protein